MVLQLREYGFSGIVLYRGADLSSEQMLAAKQASEYFQKNHFSSIISDFGDFEFFAFDPNPNSIFPPVQPLFVNNWWSSRIQPSGIEIKSLEGDADWRWATHATAMVEVFNEQKSGRQLSLVGRVLGTNDSELQILVRTSRMWRWNGCGRCVRRRVCCWWDCVVWERRSCCGKLRIQVTKGQFEK